MLQYAGETMDGKVLATWAVDSPGGTSNFALSQLGTAHVLVDVRMLLTPGILAISVRQEGSNGGRQNKRARGASDRQPASTHHHNTRSAATNGAAPSPAQRVLALAQQSSTPEGARALLQQDEATLRECIDLLVRSMAAQDDSTAGAACAAIISLTKVPGAEGAAAMAAVTGHIGAPAAATRCLQLQVPGARDFGLRVLIDLASTDVVLGQPGIVEHVVQCLDDSCYIAVQNACYLLSQIAVFTEMGADVILQRQPGVLAQLFKHTGSAAKHAKAVSAIVNLACQATGNAALAAQQAAVADLVQQLTGSNSSMVKVAASALAYMAGHSPDLASTILEQEHSLPRLVQCVQHDDLGVVEEATFAFRQLTCQHSALPQMAGQPGLLPALVSCLTATSATAAEHAASALANIARPFQGMQALLQHRGSIGALVQCLGHDSTGVVREAGRALANVSVVNSGSMELLELSGSLAPLARCLSHDSTVVRNNAAVTLRNVAVHPAGAIAIKQVEGALPALVRGLGCVDTRGTAAGALMQIAVHQPAHTSPVWELLGQQVADNLRKDSIQDMTRNLQQAIVSAAGRSAGQR